MRLIATSRPVCGAIVLVLISVLLAGCAPTRHIEAARVLQDFAAGDANSQLKRGTALPVRQTVSYRLSGRTHRADLYLPGSMVGCAAPRRFDAIKPGCPRAAIVVVPGAVPQGKDDARLVAFATTMARAGFAVLVPEIEGFRQLRIRPSDARVIADAFAYLVSRPELAPHGHAGMLAFSYAVGPTLLAALQDDIRQQVRFVVGIGGYYDLPRTMRFFTTGWYEQGGKWHYIAPDDTGKMVLVYSGLDYLAADQRAHDRSVFDRMVALRMRDPPADLTALAAELSSAANTLYALADNADPARFARLYSNLPKPMRADLDQLDLAQHSLAPLKARLILVHGRSDNLIPYVESVALAAAAPAGQAQTFLIHRGLGHVDLNISDTFSRQFWREDLPDMWRLWRVIDLLLAEREAAA